jgi:hypothetical protein
VELPPALAGQAAEAAAADVRGPRLALVAPELVEALEKEDLETTL